MRRFLLVILFFSFSVYATSFTTLDKKKFVEDSTFGKVGVRTSSDYFSILPLIQQTGILQDVTFDKIVYVHNAANENELYYYGTLGVDLMGIVTVNYTSPTNWDAMWWASVELLMEATTKILLENGHDIVLEKSN